MGCNPAKAQSSMYDSFNFTIKKMNLESFDKVMFKCNLRTSHKLKTL